MNEHFRVAFVLTFDFFAVEINCDDVLRPDLFESETVGLHENPLLPGNPHRHMAENMVPVPLVRENIA
jgi:hypothetical protein